MKEYISDHGITQNNLTLLGSRSKKSAIKVLILLVIACSVISVNSWACSATAWNDTSGSVAANAEQSMGGDCGLKVTGTGYVQDNTPLNEGQFIGRFYFLPQLGGAGDTKIFVAYSDESGTELFSVVYNGSAISVVAGDTSALVPVTTNRWHLIEFRWVSGGTGQLWVNADARLLETQSADFASGTGQVQSVRLGAPDGFGGDIAGTAFFDDYVSHRNDPIGGFCNINIDSGVTVVNEEEGVFEACEGLVMGPEFTAEDGADVILRSGLEIEMTPGFSINTGATLSATVCGQSLCNESATPMTDGCHSCVSQVCALDNLCCSNSWSAACVAKVEAIPGCNLMCADAPVVD